MLSDDVHSARRSAEHSRRLVVERTEPGQEVLETGLVEGFQVGLVNLRELREHGDCVLGIGERGN